ncbi:apoptosis regulator BAX [Aplysia californica]|uniref:Apoptosis regulator BAX n=1 Tax=Aplysia californica TaxID=6500 RepID=A0ABM0JYC2_APLCA|nr:apoptosis regulator BAX [Aplysia californica]
MTSKEQKPFFAGGDIIPGSGNSRQRLSEDDVTNQGRYLLNNFIYERMKNDGLENIPGMEQLQEPGTPRGPPMEHVREIGRALRFIGDDLDKDQTLQDAISMVPPEAERATLLNVARNIFEDGVFNWGRVVALFYYAYKVCSKALDRIPLVRAIINLIVDFMREHVVKWIIERGGWEAIREYFGTSSKQIGLIVGASAVAVFGVYLYKNWF